MKNTHFKIAVFVIWLLVANLKNASRRIPARFSSEGQTKIQLLQPQIREKIQVRNKRWFRPTGGGITYYFQSLFRNFAASFKISNRLLKTFLAEIESQIQEPTFTFDRDANHQKELFSQFCNNFLFIQFFNICEWNIWSFIEQKAS